INIVEQRDRIDSPEWFAAEILDDIDLLRKVIARGEAATIAHFALKLGGLMKTAEFKFRWEAAAITGKPLLEGRPRGNKNSALSRGETKQERQNLVRKVADELRKEDSALTKEEVISHLRKKQKSDKILNEILDKVSDASLRKDLQKPERWSTLKSHVKKIN